MIDKLTIIQQSFFAEPKKRAIAALAIAVTTYGFIPILVRLAENEISPAAVIFHRLWIAALMLGVWNGVVGLRRKSFDLLKVRTHKTLGLLLGCSICFAATQLLWAWSLAQTSVANSALLHNFTPLFVTLGGWLLFAQNFDRRFIIGTIVAITGSIILGLDDFLYEANQIQGDTIALISSLFLAFYLLLLEQIGNQFEIVTIVFYYCAIATLTIVPFLPISQQPILPSSLSGWLTILCLAFFILLTYLLTTYSIKFLSSGMVAVIILIEPVLSAILAWGIFSETLDFWNLVAFPVILFGIYLATTSKSVIKDEKSTQFRNSTNPKGNS